MSTLMQTTPKDISLLTFPMTRMVPLVVRDRTGDTRKLNRRAERSAR